MASYLLRNLVRPASGSYTTAAARCLLMFGRTKGQQGLHSSAALQQKKKDKKKKEKVIWMMNDPIEHATGLEKKELKALAGGNDDPFGLILIKRQGMKKDQATQVPSLYGKRIIGCICHEDSICVNWMWVHKGEPRRCECGYYFEITDRTEL